MPKTDKPAKPPKPEKPDKTEKLMAAAKNSCDQLTKQVDTAQNCFDKLEQQRQLAQGLADRASTVVMVKEALARIAQAQKTREDAEEAIAELAKLVPAAEKAVKDLDTKVKGKTAKAMLGLPQKTLADAKVLLLQVTKTLAGAKKDLGEFNAGFDKQAKSLDAVKQTMDGELIAGQYVLDLEEFCGTTLVQAKQKYAELEKGFMQERDVVRKIRAEVDDRPDWTSQDRDGRLADLKGEVATLEKLKTASLAVSRQLATFWNVFNNSGGGRSKSPAVQKLRTQANTQYKTMASRIDLLFDAISDLSSDIQSLGDRLMLKAREGAEAERLRAAAKAKALKVILDVQEVAAEFSDRANTMSVWTPRQALLKKLLTTKPPLHDDVREKLQEIETAVRGDLRTTAEDTKKLATVEKVAQNNYRLCQDDQEVEDAWKATKEQLTNGKTATEKFGGFLEEMKTLVKNVNAAHPRA
jgi:hypothetical protein